MKPQDDEADKLAQMRTFYDTVYYRHIEHAAPDQPTRHLTALAGRLHIGPGQAVLDVACGAGTWLACCHRLGARVHGVDLSTRAIAACRARLPDGEFFAQAAETLPFESQRFDVITCLGSLEHFLDPVSALREMVRVAKPGAQFVLLVPNADFLTRRLGLYGGTQQVDAKEEVRSLEQWQALFAEAGLTVQERWRDLHVLSWAWIRQGPWWRVPVRALQAVALAVWPLRWQYQVYHLCRTGEDGP